jgi:hypothetical protein
MSIAIRKPRHSLTTFKSKAAANPISKASALLAANNLDFPQTPEQELEAFDAEDSDQSPPDDLNNLITAIRSNYL